jgi:predicted N-formylglutamate amidohydrolase
MPSKLVESSLRGAAGPSGSGKADIRSAGSHIIAVENPAASGPFVIVCDHASNRIPEDYQSFGFEEDALKTHIAWDPGALGVARQLAARFDSPLIWPDASRLIIDCNRAPDAKTLIVTESEGRPVPANRALPEAERKRRLGQIHRPYHAAIEACLERRLAGGRPTAVLAIHSYTPVYLGKARPWEIGIVFGEDRRLADVLIRGLQADAALTVGINQPYSPADQVYYTVERHAGPRGLPAVMIEIRNNEIGDKAGERKWADRLGDLLLGAERQVAGAGHAAV